MVRVKIRVLTFPSDPREQNSFLVGTSEVSDCFQRSQRWFWWLTNCETRVDMDAGRTAGGGRYRQRR